MHKIKKEKKHISKILLAKKHFQSCPATLYITVIQIERKATEIVWDLR